MEDVSSYPLAWPAGWKRGPLGGTKDGRFSKYKRPLSIAQAIDRLESELDKMGIRNWNFIVSTNLRVGQRGGPLVDQSMPADRGAAVYFKMKDQPRVLACDLYRTVADNVAAIAAHVECMRGIERYGVGSLDQAFAGYSALPAPSADNRPPWRKVLGFGDFAPVTLDGVNAQYRKRAMEAANNESALALLNLARDEARKELS